MIVCIQSQKLIESRINAEDVVGGDADDDQHDEDDQERGEPG